ncbi:hypothetical protein Pan216_47200 [Planctomycetes bacterium Pan216]|uniref:Uncharacterized protein n=1 Tax=Kolteria novifilia TaxID=2527975 RepID=A0A518BA43_9BACT|nr:hypothetical protein Pan216_47200 [Planctomycetes bacterium Pan216]
MAWSFASLTVLAALAGLLGLLAASRGYPRVAKGLAGVVAGLAVAYVALVDRRWGAILPFAGLAVAIVVMSLLRGGRLPATESR